MQPTSFPINLRHACSTRKSVSEICRQLGVNRQQFNRYVNGEAVPSPHNLARIAAFFGVRPADFSLDPALFELRLVSAAGGAFGTDVLHTCFPGNLPSLRRHLGYYQTYHVSLSWPGMIVCSCARLDEHEGAVRVKSIERIQDRPHEIRQFSKYVGLASFLRNRIFVVERSTGPEPMIAQTILTPFETHQRIYLRGMTMGVSWRKQNLPYASRVIWRHLGTDTDRRQLLSRCGVLPPGSRQLPPTVREFLDASENPAISIPFSEV
ncbi:MULTISPECIES: helix-turn-helix transcriptional regulator [unclassified Shinella]|uniref:helix-turn-helix domain-containing protein n=1 Tax=unclassified Shinella TaxID=2643062 RepID=UPI00225D5285|nr:MULTISPECIES: helix-turn-helix transcriptional regulator [unclassified Shinella]MCO5137582.1 helix-turn-helix domain-containing protein [Shinella sp.]MDC7257700.1 helix-turn-helix domain-containing protein [Shinella sp. YE25]CAI0335558.1 Transcriptional regulator [Rhizobiaceae bacterium]CAK7259863.1 Transcriptional regulator [Shinella sp. WSC3-e]